MEDTAADLGKHADLGVFVLEGQVLVVPVHAVIREDVIDGIRINVSGGTLVGTTGEEIRIQLRITDEVGRDRRLGFLDLDLG